MIQLKQYQICQENGVVEEGGAYNFLLDLAILLSGRFVGKVCGEESKLMAKKSKADAADITIEIVPGDRARERVDRFYEKNSKAHRARDADIFFLAFFNEQIIGAVRFCVEEATPLLRGMQESVK